MKNLSLTFCLMIEALFGNVGSGFALKTVCETDYDNVEAPNYN